MSNDRTVRRLTAFLALAAMIGTPAGLALAQAAAPEAPKVGRYTMVPAEGGFVRLDTETGIVSHCRRDGDATSSTWRCSAIPEAVLGEPATSNRELADAVDELGREVASLRMRLDAMEHPPEAQAPLVSKDPDLDRALNFSEELMRRFFGMVRGLKADAEEDRT